MKGTFFDSFRHADDEEAPIRNSVADDNAKLDDDDPDKITDVSTVSSAADNMGYSDDSDDDNTGGTSSTVDDSNKTTEEDKTKTESKVNEPEEEEEDDASWLAGVVNPLAEEGVLYYDPEKEYLPGEEGFVEVIQDTIEKRWEEKVNSIPEEYRSIIDHLAAGKPLTEWRESVDLFDYTTIDMEDEGNQINLISEAMELQGFDADEIKERLESLEDAGAAVLKKEAEISQKYMVKHVDKARKEYETNLKAQVIANEAKQEADREKLRADIYGLDEIAGFKLDKKTKEKLYDHLTKPVGKTGKTQMMLNRDNPEKQILAAYLDMIDYKFEDVEKKAATKVSRGLKAALNNFTDKNARKASGSRQVVDTKSSLRVPKGIWNTNREIED